jgi:NAD(P)-dependent dehydrogenase (short-subunit alcohol dehydrogenase family)
MEKQNTPTAELEGRVAIVTGAGKGLGRSYALQLAQRGARVLVNNRVRPGQPDSAAAVVLEIEASGGVASVNRDSVESAGTGKRLVEQALDEYGSLDILVANAGMDHPGVFHKQDWDDFETIFRINFQGTAQLLHAAWKPLRETVGARVLVSTSSAGLYGNHGQSAYAASKAALIAMMRSLALETQKTDLRINAIAPYAVTPLTQAWFPPTLVSMFSSEVVAELVCWLVSGQCQLHGKTIVVGGGGVRLAQMQETETMLVAGDLEAAIAQLVSLPKDQAPAHASGEFEVFANSLRDQCD